jgi:peptide/nickel transport system substrate-binding protein
MLYRHLIAFAIMLLLAACGRSSFTLGNPIDQQNATTGTNTPSISSPTASATTTVIPTPQPERLLTICLVNEPRSLFLYNAVSSSEQSVLSAIYDGPIDIKNFESNPVILEQIPSLDNGDAFLQPVQVNSGDLIVDTRGNLTNLDQGVQYRPSGCTQQACSQTYAGNDPVEMDQVVLHFKLLPGLQWSDGAPLTAADSVYSFEVARALYPSAVPERVSRTASYRALDDLTVEWVGVPGFMDGLYQTKFFSPLPQHAWASIAVSELATSEVSSRLPLGYGPYVLDSWVAGDHITLHANPLYFRAKEGLPHFDNLVYRFVAAGAEALAAVQAGECDLVEEAAGLESLGETISQLSEAGKLAITLQTDTAWELLAFDIKPIDPARPAFFASSEVRRAVAICVDRQRLVDQLSSGQSEVAELYTPPSHPLYNKEAIHYSFDPATASAMLTAAGWKDEDGNPSTPRVAQGVTGITDGTEFKVEYLTSDDAEHQNAAQLVQADLQQCGVQVEVISQPVEQFLAAGPDGPVFGRKFDLAQFAWMTAVEPPCSLYLSDEIPGPYPDYPKSWGGMNAGGYSNPQFDQACLNALYSLPDLPQHAEQHSQAQVIFADDLPVLPLYWHYQVVIERPDMCGVPGLTGVGSVFTDLELFNYGPGCP